MTSPAGPICYLFTVANNKIVFDTVMIADERLFKMDFSPTARIQGAVASIKGIATLVESDTLGTFEYSLTREGLLDSMGVAREITRRIATCFRESAEMYALIYNGAVYEFVSPETFEDLAAS